MKTFTAKEAKTHFGEFLDAMQREPVIVTKNGRSVGMMVSMDDPLGLFIHDSCLPKSPGHDEWVDAMLTKRLAAYCAGEPTLSHEEVVAGARARLKARVAEHLNSKAGSANASEAARA
jgi:prevent-host-death family protein